MQKKLWKALRVNSSALLLESFKLWKALQVNSSVANLRKINLWNKIYLKYGAKIFTLTYSMILNTPKNNISIVNSFGIKEKMAAAL